MSRARRPPRRVLVRAALLAFVAAGAVSLLDALGQTPGHTPGAGAEQQARATCGGCHGFPPADILPRAAWRDEVVRMMFIRDNRLPPTGPPGIVGRNVTLPADMEQALAYYSARAPERLPAPEPWPAADASPIPFTRRSITMPDMPGTPAVSHVRLLDLDGDGRLDLLGTDMRHGSVFSATSLATATALSVLATIPHPARVSRADIDGDGLPDLLVGDMGEFFPADHNKGAVIWLRGRAGGRYGAFWLDEWPRVAGVEATDFNGDGKLDLAVAAFGWRKTGHVAIVENRTTNPARPEFIPHIVDPRPGAIQILPVDLNRDGRTDFITLLAQEHETVLGYINTGAFGFERRVIYIAPHPNWGSSGIQIADLDKDGDTDVVLTHGDTFDDGIVKPYHGIEWLENTGNYPYVAHTVAQVPGVHGAAIADLDADGDLDIVAGALLAGGSDLDEKVLPALVWLEQTRPRTFVRHTVEMGFPRHASVDAGDIDGDGDVDIVAGNFSIGQFAAGWVDVWVNGLKQPVTGK